MVLRTSLNFCSILQYVCILSFTYYCTYVVPAPDITISPPDTIEEAVVGSEPWFERDYHYFICMVQ